MLNLKRIGTVEFPQPQNVIVNMMPIVMGDESTLPNNMRGYFPIINSTGLEKGRVAYLTIHESQLAAGNYQRRPGVHTDGTVQFGWGGGGWGGGTTPPKDPKKPDKGIYMASNDGLCQAWDTVTYEVDNHGACRDKFQNGIKLDANALYWMTDRTPHESLASDNTHFRQFFRLVADEIGVWWAKHSTPSPFGVMPNCRIEHGVKF